MQTPIRSCIGCADGVTHCCSCSSGVTHLCTFVVLSTPLKKRFFWCNSLVHLCFCPLFELSVRFTVLPHPNMCTSVFVHLCVHVYLCMYVYLYKYSCVHVSFRRPMLYMRRQIWCVSSTHDLRFGNSSTRTVTITIKSNSQECQSMQGTQYHVQEHICLW